MTRKLKTALVAAGISIAAVSLSACGASSGGDASASTGQAIAGQAPAGTGMTGATGITGAMPPQGAGGPFASLTSDDVKCLEDEGVSVPSGPPDQNQASGQGMDKPPSARAIKKAASACGIDLPDPPGQTGTPGRPGTSGQTPPQKMPPASQAPGSTGTTQPPAAATS